MRYLIIPGLAGALALSASLATPQVAKQPAQPPVIEVDVQDVVYQGGTGIRILPPRGGSVSGPTLVETLLLNPDVRQVAFYVDGELRTRRKRPPWQTKLKFDIPAREQVVRVEALDMLERVVGRDELVFNRVAKPLRVTIRSLERQEGSVRVAADVSTPDTVELLRLRVHLNDNAATTLPPADLDGDRLDVSVAAGEARDHDFVRVVADLADGRSIEDTQLVSGSIFQEEIDVRLVQLQVLVTDKQGRPLKGFQKDHFTIQDRGGDRQPAGLFEADDVSLLLGYALDSSGSMVPIWTETLGASRMFLDATLTDRDEAFLVDFDWTIRLVEARTGNKSDLEAGLAEVVPEGGTALYDAVLYSLLQFDRQQGRRGLVVLTDGFDVDSKADPRRAVEFAQRLGVPVYIVALETPESVPTMPTAPGGAFTLPGASPKQMKAALAELRLLTDPSGGRLIRVRTLEQMRQALAQINAEMRNQYVLTYYTDTPPEPGKPPAVTVMVEGMKDLKVRVVLGADQIY